MSAKTYVLVHGAWHGGWCWVRVADRLRAHGHRVTTPTQTGLGERAHLLSPSVDLATFTADVVNHILAEDLSEVVLVGHSFGGYAITGAAHTIPERLSRLVYLDARVPVSDGSSMTDRDRQIVEDRRARAMASSGGLSVPPPPASAFAVFDQDDAAWLESKMTPHPMKTFEDAIHFAGDPNNGLPVEYILAADPIYEPLSSARDRVRALGWPMREIATGHDAMVTAPDALAAMLEGD